MTDATVVAIDLGASSGRVMFGRVGEGGVNLREVHRFANQATRLPSGLHWDIAHLFAEVLAGLRAVARAVSDGERVASIGIDTWAVDYGLLDAHGDLIGLPYCYRDQRTADAVDAVRAVVSPQELYAINGLQFLPFNTVYQLVADQRTPRWEIARTIVLLPDLIGYWLTGEIGAELTNASTTGLLGANSGTWSIELAERLGVPADMLPPLRRPGDVIGTLLPAVADATGLPASTPVIAVGSHDTASAVVAVPASSDRFGYVSCGTWSLVGVELTSPVLTEASRSANFTNETGVDGTVRYLRNVMGLWLLNESIRAWSRAGQAEDLRRLLDAANELPEGGPLVDPDDPAFLPPGDMPARIAQACLTTGQPVPRDRPAMVRCILDSLAVAYARALDDAHRLSGRDVDAVHIVGGGARNWLLCQLTARIAGLPVLAGPVEATALGNAAVQARAVGALPENLADVRQLLVRTQDLVRYDYAGQLIRRP